MLKVMKDMGMAPEVGVHINPILEGCLRANKLDKVEEIFQLLGYKEGEYPHQSSLMIIKGASKANRIEFALHYYKNLIKSSRFIDCTITLNALLDSCINCDKLDFALQIFEAHLDQILTDDSGA